MEVAINDVCGMEGYSNKSIRDMNTFNYSVDKEKFANPETFGRGNAMACLKMQICSSLKIWPL